MVTEGDCIVHTCTCIYIHYLLWLSPAEIPKVKFVNHSISHDMGSENPPKISVALTTAVVRAFVVEIAVKEEDCECVCVSVCVCV